MKLYVHENCVLNNGLILVRESIAADNRLIKEALRCLYNLLNSPITMNIHHSLVPPLPPPLQQYLLPQYSHPTLSLHSCTVIDIKVVLCYITKLILEVQVFWSTNIKHFKKEFVQYRLYIKSYVTLSVTCALQLG